MSNLKLCVQDGKQLVSERLGIDYTSCTCVYLLPYGGRTGLNGAFVHNYPINDSVFLHYNPELLLVATRIIMFFSGRGAVFEIVGLVFFFFFS